MRDSKIIQQEIRDEFNSFFAYLDKQEAFANRVIAVCAIVSIFVVSFLY